MILASAAIAAAGLALLLTQAHVRLLEATVAAHLLRVAAVSGARAVGSSVIFPRGQQWMGFTITASCTAAFLIAPFYLIGSALLLSGRIRVRTALMAVATATLIVWFVNQLRLMIIGWSMSIWGFRTGYSRSHILAGGVVSTLGVAIGIAAYVALILHERPPPRPTEQP
jgi:exosortase/archaeosortase family protein